MRVHKGAYCRQKRGGEPWPESVGMRLATLEG
jgi:hypothetical protein